MAKMLAFVLICTFLSASVHADALRGYIEKRAGARYLQLLQDSSKPSLAINTVTPEVQKSLAKLKEGDFIVARGSFSADGQSVTVDSIESLGLQALVGAWATPRLEVYEFRDFSQLTLYVPTKDQSDASHTKVVKAGDFNYAVTPDQGSGYSIFVSDNRSVTIGVIEFKKSRLKLTVIDPQTGQVSSELTLSPLATQQPLK